MDVVFIFSLFSFKLQNITICIGRYRQLIEYLMNNFNEGQACETKTSFVWPKKKEIKKKKKKKKCYYFLLYYSVSQLIQTSL